MTHEPTSPEEIMEWLKEHPGEPFFFTESSKRLFIGVQTDEGEIEVWDCDVRRSLNEFVEVKP